MTNNDQSPRAGDGKTRERFEAYFAASRKSKGVGRAPIFERFPDDTYKDDHTQRHWWTWQQALAAAPAAAPAEQVRRAALEEAANALEPLKARWLPNVRDIYVVGECAATIRALIPKPRAHPKQIAGVGCALCGTNEAGYYCTGACGEHQDAAENQAPATADGSDV